MTEQLSFIKPTGRYTADVDTAACQPRLPAHQRHSATSKAAAEKIAPKVNALQREVLAYIWSCGDAGATDKEIQRATGLSGDTQRPRRVELCDPDRWNDQPPVIDSGRKRALCTVWVAAVHVVSL